MTYDPNRPTQLPGGFFDRYKRTLERTLATSAAALSMLGSVAGCDTKAAGETPTATKTTTSAPNTPSETKPSSPAPSHEAQASSGTVESTPDNPYPKLYDLKLDEPSLSPDKAAKMSDEELAKALQITMADIDPSNFGKSYARAVVDRRNTWIDLGLTSDACIKIDPNTFDPEALKEKIVNKYYDLANVATFGPKGAGWSHELPNNIIGRYCNQNYAIAAGLWPHNTESPELGVTLVAGAASATKNPDGSYTGTFAMRETQRPPKGSDPMGSDKLKPFDTVQIFTYTAAPASTDGERWILTELQDTAIAPSS